MAAQFLDDKWLEAIQRHRRDLTQGRSDKEVLDLRRNPELAQKIAAWLIEEYAAMLNRRGLPITPGSLHSGIAFCPVMAVLGDEAHALVLPDDQHRIAVAFHLLVQSGRASR